MPFGPEYWSTYSYWTPWFKQWCHRIRSYHPTWFYHPSHCSLYSTCCWMTKVRSCAQHVWLHSPIAPATFRCNLCGKRDEVTIVTGYLRWGQGDPEALLLPLSHLDPESRGQERVRSHSLQAATQCYSKSSNHSCQMGLWTLLCGCMHVSIYACLNCVWVRT